ncbi:hypothetical protein XELAEV_18014452mg [Xenopus laevis]|uniref:Uncharacterized protein n=1 Tax=Xenopus laevis TaxID=8355 RepID=A0A974HVF5_XENLA|nr:hypothetical protein XELAEV_18014452mg [Xenopus laevis]
MGNTNSKQPEGIPAFEIVKRREGTKAVKEYDKLAKICDLTSHGPRLQPENWRIVVAERRGLLRDKGLLESAEAWLRVARDLQREFWSEQRVIQPDGKVKYLYHREPPFPCMVNVQPPPYNGASEKGSPGYKSFISIANDHNRNHNMSLFGKLLQSSSGNRCRVA